jgi:multiple sugar transport system permease protein
MEAEAVKTRTDPAAAATLARARSIRRRRYAGVYAALLPSVLLIFGIVYYPIANTFVLSLYKTNAFGVRQAFIGMGNYQALLQDANFRHALQNTVVWTFWVVALTLVISLGISLMLDVKWLKFRGLYRTILMLPWATSLTIQSVLWRWILNGEYGLLNYMLLKVHLIREPVHWLAQPETSMPAMIYVGVFVSIPFTTTVLMAGLQTIDGSILEAAAVDGAGWWGRLWHIILPLLKPVFNIVLILNMIYVFNSFPIIWIITRGDPANRTDTFITYLYKLAFLFGNQGKAAAAAVISFGILLAFTLVYLRLQQKGEEF